MWTSNLINVRSGKMNSKSEVTKQDIYLNKVLALRKVYKRQSGIVFFLHITFQLTTVIGATSLPFMLNLPDLDKHIPTIISAIVAVAAAISTFGRLGERARNLH